MAAFLGHADYGGRKHDMAIGMLDPCAGIAVACGSAAVSFANRNEKAHLRYARMVATH